MMKSAIKSLSVRTKQKIRALLAVKNQNQNLYHCCIQKTGSQWLKQIFADPIFWQLTSLQCHAPAVNYLNPDFFERLTSESFPQGKVITPLYARYDEFQLMPKPENYKAIFIMRDYRDVVVSDYFSYRYSHPIEGREFMAKRRELLNTMSQDEGMMLMIQDVRDYKSGQLDALNSWINASNDRRILLCKFEDIIGNNSLEGFQKIFAHFDIKISDSQLKQLLDSHSFAKLSKGRDRGKENQKSHYRKGIAGDWKNYLNEDHKSALKDTIGDLLVKLGYESDLNW